MAEVHPSFCSEAAESIKFCSSQVLKPHSILPVFSHGGM